MSALTLLEPTFEKEAPHDGLIRAQLPEEEWEAEEGWDEEEDWNEEDSDAWDDDGWDDVEDQDDDLDELEEFGNDERFSPVDDDEEEW